MTTAANDLTRIIGPATERRIMMAFAETSLLTCAATAKLLGIDEKTLRILAEEGVIRSVRRGGGRTRAYTEGDIRAYLTESSTPCRSTSPQKAPSGTMISSRKVVDFTARRALKRAARQKK